MTDTNELAGKRVAICEDEGITVMQLEKWLTLSGFVVVGKARDGYEGVDLVLRERPDIVLMDIVMPGRDGLEAARQILAEFQTCIVMLTANADQEHMEQARALGAAGYIPKPVSGEQLLPILKQALHMFYQCNP